MATVSIIMPMKNAEKFVKQAIDSILYQTYSDLELVIVDDKSTDTSREIVEKINDKRIKLVIGPGKGISLAFNLALQASAGYYICRCDADDIYPLDRIEHQVRWLEARPSFGAVCGAYEAIDESGILVIKFENGLLEEDITNELLSSRTRTHFCTFLTKKSVLVELGGCRSYFITAEDIDLQLRIAEVAKVAYMPLNCYQYRIHNLSITHTQSSLQRRFFEDMARAFRKERSIYGQDNLQKGVPPNIPLDYSPGKTSNQHIAGFLVCRAWSLHQKGQKWESVKTGFRACTICPLDYFSWRNLLVLILKTCTSG